MTETLTGRQVLALLAQDEAPEIEYQSKDGQWFTTTITEWFVSSLREAHCVFRIKPKPQRRIIVTLANGEVVSWPEPMREAPEVGANFWHIDYWGIPIRYTWGGDNTDKRYLAFGNVHLTKEAAQEHADALYKLNTQEAK